MKNGQFNAYRFTSVRSLREAFRRYRALEGMADVTSATILLDLRRALGDDPSFPTKVITRHQRLAIQVHLIDDQSAVAAAKQLGIETRTLYRTERRALEKLLRWLQEETELRDWQPWMIQLLRDPRITLREVARRTGKTTKATEHAATRYRTSEGIPYRPRSRRTARTAS